jgi:hypothetical protein
MEKAITALLPAEHIRQAAQCWQAETKSLQFIDASANFVYAFEHEGRSLILRLGGLLFAPRIDSAALGVGLGGRTVADIPVVLRRRHERQRPLGHDTAAPLGKHVLGRVLDGTGKPIDGLPRLTSASKRPIYRPATSAKRLILETGIKIIDLLAPLKHGRTRIWPLCWPGRSSRW